MKKHRIVQGKEKKSSFDLVKLCTKCGQQIRKKNHVCKGKKKCHICKEIVDFSHRCYIQPYQSKMNHDSDDEESSSFVKKPLFFSLILNVNKTQGFISQITVLLTEHVIYVSIKHSTFIVPHVVNSKKEEKLFSKARKHSVNFVTGSSQSILGITAIAHNFKGYDGQFILNRIIEVGFKLPKLIMNGNNIMKLELNGIRLIDSFNFMNFALAKFPATFSLQEMKKGYFPHWANTDKYWDYIGPYLYTSYYKPELMSE